MNQELKVIIGANTEALRAEMQKAQGMISGFSDNIQKVVLGHQSKVIK